MFRNWHEAAATALVLILAGVGATGAAAADDSSEGALANGQPFSPFDLSSPAVNRLDPSLLDAIERAAHSAAADGITIGLNSGGARLSSSSACSTTPSFSTAALISPASTSRPRRSPSM